MKILTKVSLLLGKRRFQMFFFGSIIWGMIASWTIAAFWTHIERLHTSYGDLARLGAITGEVAAFCFLFLHCFDPKEAVRKRAIYASVVLVSFLLLNSGIQWKLEAEASSEERTQRHKVIEEDNASLRKQQEAGILEAIAQKQLTNLENGRKKRFLSEEAKVQLALEAQRNITSLLKEAPDRNGSNGSEKQQIKEAETLEAIWSWYTQGGIYLCTFFASFVLFLWVGSQMVHEDAIEEAPSQVSGPACPDEEAVRDIYLGSKEKCVDSMTSTGFSTGSVTAFPQTGLKPVTPVLFAFRGKQPIKAVNLWDRSNGKLVRQVVQEAEKPVEVGGSSVSTINNQRKLYTEFTVASSGYSVRIREAVTLPDGSTKKIQLGKTKICKNLTAEDVSHLKSKNFTQKALQALLDGGVDIELIKNVG